MNNTKRNYSDKTFAGRSFKRYSRSQTRSEFVVGSLRELNYEVPTKGYAIFTPPGRYDQFVYPALKSFDPELYRSIKGYTRRGTGEKD